MNSHPIPEGYRSITPYLKHPHCGRLVDFLKKAFDATERGRLLKPDGTVLHAELVVGDSLLMIHEAPPGWDVKHSSLYLYVKNVDAIYERAIAAGATSASAPTTMYYGDRVARVTDVAGNDWWIATRIETQTLEEVQEQAAAYCATIMP
jgi:uncharacterized glyoxalase superfamily protein PhnB